MQINKNLKKPATNSNKTKSKKAAPKKAVAKKKTNKKNSNSEVVRVCRWVKIEKK